MEAVDLKKEQRGFWNKFYDFLAYGGILLIVLFILGIVFLISILTK